MKSVLTVLCCLLVASCASTNVPSGPIALPEVSAGYSQIVIYRPSEFAFPRKADIAVNGVEKCELPGSSYTSYNIAPNNSTIVSSSLWDTPGTSTLTFPAAANKRHFVRITFKNTVESGAVFGVIGSALVGKGPFSMNEVNSSIALQEMSNLKQIRCP